MYKNIHNKDLDTIIDLNYSKEIWDRLQLIHEGETSSANTEKEKIKKNKKNLYKKESVQWNGVYASVNRPYFQEENIVEEQANLRIALTKIERLKNETKDLNKLMQICDERENEYKE